MGELKDITDDDDDFFVQELTKENYLTRFPNPDDKERKLWIERHLNNPLVQPRKK